MTLLDWLGLHFTVEEWLPKRKEAKFNCPKCEHPSFYFNVIKRVGFCHRDNCHWSPHLRDLEDLAGDEFVPSGTYWRLPEEEVEREYAEVSIPTDARPLVELKEGVYHTPYPTASNAVANRGVSVEDQYRFNIHISLSRVYIPVYDDGKLVSYVGRALWWTGDDAKLRYAYPEGAPVSNYIYNWDEAQLWDRITLVENTFNGIWLRNLQCTSNFGSNLSAVQMEKLARAKCTDSIVLLWDKGAAGRAESVVNRLSTIYGINSAWIDLPYGQPDDHSFDYIEQAIDRAHEEAIS